MANPHPVTKGRTGKNNPKECLIRTMTHAWLIKRGQKFYDTWADANPTEAMKLAGKDWPTQIAGEITVRKAVGLDI